MFSQWERAADCIFPCLYTSPDMISELHSTAFKALKALLWNERKSGTN